MYRRGRGFVTSLRGIVFSPTARFVSASADGDPHSDPETLTLTLTLARGLFGWCAAVPRGSSCSEIFRGAVRVHLRRFVCSVGQLQQQIYTSSSPYRANGLPVCCVCTKRGLLLCKRRMSDKCNVCSTHICRPSLAARKFYARVRLFLVIIIFPLRAWWIPLYA